MAADVSGRQGVTSSNLVSSTEREVMELQLLLGFRRVRDVRGDDRAYSRALDGATSGATPVPILLNSVQFRDEPLRLGESQTVDRPWSMLRHRCGGPGHCQPSRKDG